MALNQISVNATRVAVVLGAVAFLLVAVSIAVQLTVHLSGHQNIYGLVRLFNLNEE